MRAGSLGGMGGPPEVRESPRHLPGTADRISVMQLFKRDVTYLVKYVIPGNDIEYIGPFRDVWSMAVPVNTMGGDQGP